MVSKIVSLTSIKDLRYDIGNLIQYYNMYIQILLMIYIAILLSRISLRNLNSSYSYFKIGKILKRKIQMYLKCHLKNHLKNRLKDHLKCHHKNQTKSYLKKHLKYHQQNQINIYFKDHQKYHCMYPYLIDGDLITRLCQFKICYKNFIVYEVYHMRHVGGGDYKNHLQFCT